MYSILSFVNEEMDELESVTLQGTTIKEVLNIINQVDEFVVGKAGLLHEKSNWTAVDFKRNIIQVMVKEPV
jgi:hypothetical protein